LPENHPDGGWVKSSGRRALEFFDPEVAGHCESLGLGEMEFTGDPAQMPLEMTLVEHAPEMQQDPAAATASQAEFQCFHRAIKARIWATIAKIA
jgi:hypothetical protein